MIVSRIYEAKNEELAAVVLEDGVYTNFIWSPEMVCFDEAGLLEEAKWGFPEALSYEDDISEGHSLEDMVRLQEEESKLIVEVGEHTIIYPQRMSEDTQELFKFELGEELWNKILQDSNIDKGVQID